MEIIKINSSKSSGKTIRKAVETLKIGGIVMFPTETVYGLGVDFKNKKAVRNLYQLKGRNFNKALPIIVSNKNQINKVAVINKIGLKLIKKYLPGPLTIVFKKKKIVSALVSANKKTVAIRYPKHKIALSLAAKFPIASTSANISGKPPAYSVKQFLNQFKTRKNLPDLILDVGRLPKVLPSTIVDVSKGKIVVLRKGPVLIKRN